jgi:hypothetical protein
MPVARGAKPVVYTDAAGQPVQVHTLCFGPGVELHDVRDFAQVYNLCRNDGLPSLKKACNYLRAHGVGLYYWSRSRVYYNPVALEASVLMLTRFGGPGFISPGAAHLKSRGARCFKGIPDQVTPELIAKNSKGLMDDLKNYKGLHEHHSRQKMLSLAKKVGAKLQKAATEVAPEPQEPSPEEQA